MAQELLNEDQIRALAKSPKYRNEINWAIRYQDRLKRHSVPYLDRSEAVRKNTSIRDHFDYVSGELDSNQFAKYQNYYKFPQSTLKMTDKIYDDQFRIFKPSDRVEDIRLKRPGDIPVYLDFYKGFKEWLRSDGYQIYRERTCNLVFIDMPKEAKGMPLYYEVDIKDCVDYDPLDNGELNYALFDNGEGYIWVDSEKYMFFNYVEEGEQDKDADIDSGGVELGTLKDEAVHDQDFTPCRQFWSDNLDNRFNKETAISRKLADLDSYDFLENGKDHNDIVNIFPTKWSVRQQCDFEQELNDETQSCSNGWLVDKNGGRIGTLGDDGVRVDTVCPGCKGGNNTKYAGVHLLVDPPTEDVGQITQPGGFITIDPKVLEAINTELATRKDDIITSSLGQSQENNAQAKNRDQVVSELESQSSKLFKIKKNFEIFEEWFISSTASLMFGAANIISVAIDYGIKWHLEKLEELEMNFVNSIEKGLPQTLVLNDLQMVVSSRHRGDELGEAETVEWLMLEPFVGVPRADVREELKDGAITKQEWNFYRHFKALRTRFEAEFPGGILNYRPEQAASTKRADIKGKMLGWLNEILTLDKDEEEAQTQQKEQTNSNLNIIENE